MSARWLAIMVLVLAGCSTAPPVPPPPLIAAPSAPPAPPEPPDTCGAKAFQAYLGRRRSEIPVPVHPERQRVACTTCPPTMDFDPERLNFLFDAQTGLISAVRCG